METYGVACAVLCPFCGAARSSGACEHFRGWTEDGVKVLDGDDKVIGYVCGTDRIVCTGVTALVYRG
jgi:hypothetical protein